MTVHKLVKSNFKEATINGKPSIIDFHATSWCAPCRVLEPVFKQISDEIEKAQFYEVDVDKEPELAKQFSILSVPSILVLRNGI